MNRYRARGWHLIAELVGCRLDIMLDSSRMVEIFSEAIRHGGATLVGKIVIGRFPNGGLTLFGVLAESHIAAHTYHEENAGLFVDIFTCGKLDSRPILEHICLALKPEGVSSKLIERNLSQAQQKARKKITGM